MRMQVVPRMISNRELTSGRGVKAQLGDGSGNLPKEEVPVSSRALSASDEPGSSFDQETADTDAKEEDPATRFHSAASWSYFILRVAHGDFST